MPKRLLSRPVALLSTARNMVAVLAVGALGATTLFPPAPASAVGADALSFSDGSGAFGANAVVRIDGRLTYETRCPAGINDFVYPATDVYVTAAEPAAGARLEDAGNGPPNTIISTASVFIDEVIAITGPTGSLDQGSYSVVYDTCQDGIFQPSIDTVFPAVMTVQIPAILPPVSSAVVDLKVAAEEEAESWTRAQSLFKLITKIDKIVKVLVCSSPATCASVLLSVLLSPYSFSALVKAQFDLLMVNQIRHYGAIAADPPDPDFRAPTLVSPMDVAVAGDGQPLADALAAAVVPLAEEGLLAEALLHAVEKYQGAQAAGDAEWALTHARQAADLSAVLATQIRATSSALQQLREAYRSYPADLDAAYAAAVAYGGRVRASGFTPDERRELFNRGFSAAQIADRETQIRNAYSAGSVSRAGILAEFDALTAAHGRTVVALESARVAFGALAGQLDAQPTVPDVAPTARAGGPYTATPGTATTLDGAGSSTPAGTSMTRFEWDVDGDGAFDDAVGPAPSVAFTAAGPRLVGLLVTNSLGRQSVSYGTVGVTRAGRAPVLSGASPDTGSNVLSVGTPLTFAVTAADPDGNTVGYSWFVDGVESSPSGSAFRYAPGAEDVGIHVVEVHVSDGTGQPAARWRWEVAVVDVDGDLDGWTATPDCDDSDAAVSPGAFERIGNTIDDDCDAGTPDSPPGGLTGTPWLWGSNHSGQIGTGSEATIVRPPVPLPAYDDVVQVNSGFGTSYAVRADGRVLAWGSNFNGELGDGTTTQRDRPVPVVGVDGLTGQLSGVTQVSGGNGGFALARRSDGTVVSWGENRNNQNGDGSTVDFHKFPVRVLRVEDRMPLTTVQAVDAGTDQGYALLDDGTVRTWGYTYCNGSPTASTQPLAIPLQSVGSSVRQISTGERSWTMFRMADGSVRSCGPATAPILGRSVDQAHPRHDPHLVSGLGAGSGVIDISAGIEGGVALKGDGTVWAWGVNRNGSLTAVGAALNEAVPAPRQVPLPPGPPVVDVDAHSACHTEALRADGSVLVWGCDTNGSTGLPTPGHVAAPTLLPLPGAGGVAVAASMWNGIVLTRPVADTTWERPAPWVTASIADAEGAEGSPGGFDVTLSASLPHDVALSWAVSEGTADGADLRVAAGTMTIPAGSRSARIPAPVVDDAVDEDEEIYTVRITSISHGIEVARGQATGLIRDDDAAPDVSIGALRIPEGGTSLTDAVLPLRLSVPSGKPVTVNLTTEDGSAIAPGDYAAASATVSIPAGRTEGIAHLTVQGDRSAEPDESFAVRLSAPVNAGLGQATSDVTIVDDDPLALVVTSPTVNEGDGGTTPATFQVALQPPAPAGSTVLVPYRIDGGTATVPDDVAPGSGTLEFRAGDGPKTVTAQVQADDLSEPTEFFRLVLGQPAATGGRVVLPADAAAAVIVDDDPANVAPAVDAGGDVSGTEGLEVALTATVTDPDSTPVVHWSARAGGDVDAGAVCTFSAPDAVATSVRCSDDGSYTLTVSADDGVNRPISDSTELTVMNAAPRIGVLGIDVAATGTRTASVTFTDLGDDVHACTFAWGDGTPDSVVQSAMSPCRAGHTYSAGTYVLAVTITDDDGGTAAVHRSLLVYAFEGFYAPVDNLPVVNLTKAGSTVPLKFRLGGDRGLDIFAAGYPASRQIACDSHDPLDELEQTVPPGAALLTYDATSKTYHYNWKTVKSWSGTCRELNLTFADGTAAKAEFRFR